MNKQEPRYNKNLLLETILPEKERSTIDTKRLAELEDVVRDEIRTNPIIDEQVRMNPTIVKALAAKVTKALKKR